MDFGNRNSDLGDGLVPEIVVYLDKDEIAVQFGDEIYSLNIVTAIALSQSIDMAIIHHFEHKLKETKDSNGGL